MDFTVNREYKCFPTSSFLNIEVALLNKHIECTNGDKSNKLRCLVEFEGKVDNCPAHVKEGRI
ncbi:6366_t:CDS:2 [Entrophospora sp. SA101]|nr:6366_t:CDS:2 [Entrophospora sp. SA101]